MSKRRERLAADQSPNRLMSEEEDLQAKPMEDQEQPASLQMTPTPKEEEIQMKPRPWPFNGRVDNRYSTVDVRAWSDDRNEFTVRAGDMTSNEWDVDYVQDRSGSWFKISTFTARIDRNGMVDRRTVVCEASGPGRECLPGTELGGHGTRHPDAGVEKG